MLRFLVTVGLILCAPFLLCGCNSNIRPVTGTVTLDGEPVEGVLLLFTPTDVEPMVTSRAHTDANGKYELRYDSNTQGALIGKHVVQIQTDYDEEVPKKDRIKIPKKYASPDELSAEVGTGENVFDFNLTSD